MMDEPLTGVARHMAHDWLPIGYITGQTIPVDGGEWFGKKPMMPREFV